MSESLFIAIVLIGFSAFMAVLLWAQITTPTLAQRNAEALPDKAALDD